MKDLHAAHDSSVAAVAEAEAALERAKAAVPATLATFTRGVAALGHYYVPATNTLYLIDPATGALTSTNPAGPDTIVTLPDPS
jgi:hypothetical protein